MTQWYDPNVSFWSQCGGPVEWEGEVCCSVGHAEAVELCADCVGHIAVGALSCGLCKDDDVHPIAVLDLVKT